MNGSKGTLENFLPLYSYTLFIYQAKPAFKGNVTDENLEFLLPTTSRDGIWIRSVE